ncbi:unnamed protein product (macronuclear) [Paramecium tetraurelia]|uniref:Uncharacterized protein n=1 Tax=Paramecium tetraurelia TaxID=5888 RepID=A0C9S5_PARTE|nr:uncharacterized protein GSPATT00006849001 [Paramecium tetraurelia]CAK67542.1 unnamed protein product [Paramecium tetraurelia]|eukprot:XP_001434939.1 hypothetical protein (macronuclear) [Paramecium tetraurelia strain d4-2]
MFKIQQLFEENGIPFETKLDPRNYRKILDKQFTQLIQQQESEQINLEEVLQEQIQLKQQLAELIRKVHSSGKPRKKNANKIKQRKYEIKTCEAQIEQIEQQLRDRQHYQQATQEEVELLGNKIAEIKEEANESREELQRAAATVQELSQSYQKLVNQSNQIRNIYLNLQQEIKASQQKQNQLQAASLHYEQEFEKLCKEQQRLDPKLLQKQQKLEELEQLKNKLDMELSQKNNELQQSRIQLKEFEDEFNKTKSYDKLIKQEVKAQESLQMERKLLLDEFQRICSISGIDQLAQQSDEGLMNELDQKIQQNQDTIESQEKMLDGLQSEINLLMEKEETFTIRRNELLNRYHGLEKQMDDLAKKYAQFDK